MSFNHPVSDLVSRIKNGYAAEKLTIESPVSTIRESILQILKNEGYILGYSKTTEGRLVFNINLKYLNSTPVVNEIEVVSKPGRRIYCGSDKIPLVKNGLGMLIISTSQGVITDHEARIKKIGGEVLFKIF